uniref:JmjC domain-containing protein n=1 Tax=Lotharella globosa TaxID=91324 RepID=A0A7S4DPU9_9EUKA
MENVPNGYTCQSLAITVVVGATVLIAGVLTLRTSFYTSWSLADVAERHYPVELHSHVPRVQGGHGHPWDALHSVGAPVVFRSYFQPPPSLSNTTLPQTLSGVSLPSVKTSDTNNIFSYEKESNSTLWGRAQLGAYHRHYRVVDGYPSESFFSASWASSPSPPFRYCSIRSGNGATSGAATAAAAAAAAWGRIRAKLDDVARALCGATDCTTLHTRNRSSRTSSSSGLQPTGSASSAPPHGVGRVEERVWVHSAGSAAQLHMDYQDNAFAQVLGYKRFILLSPGAMARTCLHPYTHPAKRQSKGDVRGLGFERVAMTMSGEQKKESAAALGSCPSMRYDQIIAEFGTEAISEVVIGPGDVLILPAGTGHFVESVTGTLSFNVWVETSQRDVLSRVYGLLVQAALSSLREGSEEGREE